MLKSLLSDEYAALRPFVKDIWTLQSNTLNVTVQSFNFFADGLPGMMFHESDSDLTICQGQKKLPSLFLYGQTVKPIEINAEGDFRVIVFYFYPHVIRSLFGVEAHELTDTCLDFDLLPFKGVKEVKELCQNASIEKQIKLLSHFLVKRITRDYLSLETELHYATEKLTNSGGNVALKSLQDDLRVSERTFERMFLRHVGITPRLYARICRFNTAMGQLKSNQHSKLTDIAFDNGFADQSHFIRTFKEFTGLTPGEYLTNF